jgi:hypothetical protein
MILSTTQLTFIALEIQQTLPSGATVFGSAPYDGSSDFDSIIPVEKAIL